MRLIRWLAMLAGSCALLACAVLLEVRPDTNIAERAPIGGNRVTLLFDGPQTMAAMTEAIGAAHDHVHLETYIFEQDAVGQQFAELLMRQQRAGVKVRVIYDAVGTLGTPQAFFDRMQNAGIELIAFNPVNPFKLHGPWEPNHRDHRKILVVDGLVAFTGGVNISNSYAARSLFRSKSRRGTAVGWRDTHIKLQGPAVAELQRAFLATWNTHRTGEPLTGDFSPATGHPGNISVRVVASEPEGEQEIYRAHILAIRAARRSIHITSAYFVPDEQLLHALLDAAQRGVDVQLILPGVLEGGIVYYAGQSYYEELLEAGVQIHQMQVAVLHAKTAVIDTAWSTVGSTNMDTRSFLHNSELNVIVLDEGFAKTMEKAFNDDLGNARPVLAAEWAQRPGAQRLREWAARQFGYWL